MGNYFVVLFGKYYGKYVVVDFGVGLFYLILKELERGWKIDIIFFLIFDVIKFYD